MIRKFAAALFAVSTLSSSVAMALGLGEAKVSSTLNQPLNAEIELISVRDLTAAEILPALAKREDFASAGIERVHFLSDLKFNVVFKDPNKAVIRLTSDKPVREPYLNFLVEVVWPSGRLLREYALLIDPPMFSNSAPATVTAATSQPQPTRTSPTPRTVASAPAYAPTVQSTGSAGRTVSTTASDTLWGIAHQHKPSSRVSTQQTMLAIQDLNPDAFIDGNINLMKSGQVLRMPELADVEKRTFDQAVAEVRAQNRAFAEKQALSRRQLDSTGQTTAADSGTVQRSDDVLKIVAADMSAKSDENPGQTTGAKSGTAKGSGGTEQQLELTLEQLDKTTRENQELQSRLQDLEAQLETLQRLVTLKDDQLAALQSQAAVDDVEADSVLEQSAAELSAEDEVVKPVEEQVQEVSAETGTETVSVDETSRTGGDALFADEALKAEQLASEAESTENAVGDEADTGAEVAGDAAQLESAVTEAQDVSADLAINEEPVPASFIEELLSNPVYKGIAGGSIVLLLLILWLASRHNANKEKAFQEQLATAGGAPLDDDDILDLGQNDERSSTGAGAVAAAGIGAIASMASDREEADVIVEADMYMAYGRLDQASQLLEEALQETPERNDVRLKLLEVYAQAGNGEAFDQHFVELQGSGEAAEIEKAEQLRESMVGAAAEDAEPELSLDDLENELLSGSSSFGQLDDSDTVDEVSGDEAEEALDVEDLADLEDKLSESEEVSLSEDFLNIETEVEGDVKPAFGGSDYRAEETDNLDIDFDISDLDLESLEEPVSSDLTEESEESTEVTAELDDLGSIDFELETADESVESEETLDSLDAGLELGESLELDTEAEEEEASLDLGGLNLEESAEETLELGALEQPVELEPLQAQELGSEEVSLEMEPLDLDVPELKDEPVLDLSEQELSDEGFLETEAVSADDAAEDLTLEAAEEALDMLSDAALETETEADSLEMVDAVEEIAADTDLEEDDFDFLAGTDEAATKLDLARAYIDMGDIEGARDILEEVAKEGSEQQQQEAGELLKTLE